MTREGTSRGRLGEREETEMDDRYNPNGECYPAQGLPLPQCQAEAPKDNVIKEKNVTRG